jgi:hypothetical protein
VASKDGAQYAWGLWSIKHCCLFIKGERMNQKRSTTLFTALLLGSLFALPLNAMDGDKCTHDCSGMHTIASLIKCVEHAASMGHIDGDGIANSLLRKLTFAQDALEDGDSKLATNLLDAFINEVEALSGVKIHTKCANHLIEHALDVIDRLDQ